MSADFDVPEDWHESFFDGPANRFWELITPPEATAAEVDFVIRHLDVEPPARLLDIPCGAGRHALALARAGYQVTGLDSSGDAIARAAAAAGDLPVVFARADMRDFRLDDSVDGAICLGNSVGYFDHDQTAAFFACLARALRSGARFILETGVVAESLFPLQHARRMDFDGGVYETELIYDPLRSVLKTRARLTLGEETHHLRYAHHVITTGELVRRLGAVGLRVEAMYGGLDGQAYGPGSPRLLLVAGKV